MTASGCNPFIQECLQERERSLAAWELERAVRTPRRDHDQEHPLHLILRIWQRFAAGLRPTTITPSTAPEKTTVVTTQIGA